MSTRTQLNNKSEYFLFHFEGITILFFLANKVLLVGTNKGEAKCASVCEISKDFTHITKV